MYLFISTLVFALAFCLSNLEFIILMLIKEPAKNYVVNVLTMTTSVLYIIFGCLVLQVLIRPDERSYFLKLSKQVDSAIILGVLLYAILIITYPHLL